MKTFKRLIEIAWMIIWMFTGFPLMLIGILISSSRRSRLRKREMAEMNARSLFGKEKLTSNELQDIQRSVNPQVWVWIICYHPHRSARITAWKKLQESSWVEGKQGAFGERGKFLRLQLINHISLFAKDYSICRQAGKSLKGIYPYDPSAPHSTLPF